MSDALGAISYDGNKRSRFLDIAVGSERGPYGEDTARLIDAEVKRIMTDAHGTARRVLTERRDGLEAVARRLLDQEVIEGDALRQLLGMPALAGDRSDWAVPPCRGPLRLNEALPGLRGHPQVGLFRTKPVERLPGVLIGHPGA